MSKYERWIVYPLLLIALFYSLTGGNVVKATQELLEKIVTKELVVVNDEGKEMASLKYDSARDDIRFELYNKEGKRVVSLLSYGEGGAIGIFNNQGHLTAALQNDEETGALYIFNGTKKETKLASVRAGLYGGVVEVNNNRGLPTSLIGNNDQGHGYLSLYKGELLGFLKPEIVLNVEEEGGTLEIRE
ncbi:MAG: hypothetical protein GX335_01910 [Firmicutes bacterium]|nr:hypothetical protein [Bacillota bacterium]